MATVHPIGWPRNATDEPNALDAYAVALDADPGPSGLASALNSASYLARNALTTSGPCTRLATALS